MGYITKNLTSSETIRDMFKQHWMVYLNKNILLSVLITPIYGIGLPFLLYNILKIRCTELGLTSKRVILKIGIIGVKTDELKLNKVEAVEVRQGVLGRILNYGNIHMTGTGESFLIYKTVTNPSNVKKLIDETIEQIT